MRIVIPGGTGQLGQVLARALTHDGHDVDVIGRRVADPALRWDGRSDGAWMASIDGADAVINLTGRSVNCRYHWRNLRDMMQSRVDSCEAIGRAIQQARRPPAVWLQASTASIYAHTHGTPHDESGVLGGRVAGTPAYWSYSVAIARTWELALAAADTPHTRKVALRTGFTMSPDRGGIFDWLCWLTRIGFGGRFIGGDQYVSWLHDADLIGAIRFLLTHDIAGPVNLTAPEPVQNGPFMRRLREALGVPVGLPIPRVAARAGAVVLGTDIELMEKSRRVVPRRLLDAGYRFAQPDWGPAARDLAERWRAAA